MRCGHYNIILFIHSTSCPNTSCCDVCVCVYVCVRQVKSLRVQLEQESGKRAMVQNELKNWSGEAERLRGTEKQLKQEINAALETKRSLEFQLAQLSKYDSPQHSLFDVVDT